MSERYSSREPGSVNERVEQRRRLAGITIVTALAERREGGADVDISLARLNNFNKTSKYIPGTAGRSHNALARQYAINTLKSNPIQPIGGEEAPDFPLKFSILPTDREILSITSKYRAYENYARGLSFVSLLDYLRIINKRVEEHGTEAALRSVFTTPGRKVTMTVVDFLNDFSMDMLDKK